MSALYTRFQRSALVTGAVMLLGGVQVQASPLPLTGTAPVCAASSVSGDVRVTGQFVDVNRPLQRWHVQFGATHNVVSLTWMTHINGRPTWYVTKPAPLSGTGALDTMLYRLTRAPTGQQRGVEVAVGRVALNWNANNPAALGFRWRFDGEGIASVTEHSTCLQARSARPLSSSERVDDLARYGHWSTVDPAATTLMHDQRLLLSRATQANPADEGLDALVAVFDSTGQPVWLEAS